jgi:hypothetical protein
VTVAGNVVATCIYEASRACHGFTETIILQACDAL